MSALLLVVYHFSHTYHLLCLIHVVLIENHLHVVTETVVNVIPPNIQYNT